MAGFDPRCGNLHMLWAPPSPYSSKYKASIGVPQWPSGKRSQVVTAMACFPSLVTEIPHTVGEGEKKKKKKGIEFPPLWHNEISGVSGVPGRRFNPQPSTVG